MNCPRAYYLKNLYRDPVTNNKLQIASPHLTLGSTIHDTIAWYCEQEPKPTKDETIQKFRQLWKNYRQKRGGFETLEEEASFGKRGLQMVENFYNHATALDPCAPTVKFPKYMLIDGVILTGNMDYVGERADGSYSVVDFKTGARDETSILQLNIYSILTEANMGKEVTWGGFWYLDREDLPRQAALDPVQQTLDWLVEKAKEVKAAVEKNDWVCKKYPGQCKDCREYQALLDKQGEFMFSDAKFKKDIYYLTLETLPVEV